MALEKVHEPIEPQQSKAHAKFAVRGPRPPALKFEDAPRRQLSPTTTRFDGTYFFMDLPPGLYRVTSEMKLTQSSACRQLHAEARTRMFDSGGPPEKASPPTFVPLELAARSSAPTGCDDAAIAPDNGLKG